MTAFITTWHRSTVSEIREKDEKDHSFELFELFTFQLTVQKPFSFTQIHHKSRLKHIFGTEFVFWTHCLWEGIVSSALDASLKGGVIGALYLVSQPAQPGSPMQFLWGFIHLFKLDPSYPRIWQRRTGRMSAGRPAIKVTPTATHQSQRGIRASPPTRARRARGGRFPKGSEEGHWDCWGKEACWERMPLVARPYNLERCMQRTTRSPSRWKSRRSRDQT